MVTLQQTAPTMSPSEFESAARMVGELVLLAFGRASDASLSHPSVRASTRARVKRTIRARLTDPGLSLMQVALECGISLSYLHNLFRDEGFTPREYLKTERLQHARRQLELAAVSGSTVTDVALGCGFCNLSQFSTAFKAAFSVTPREVLPVVHREIHNGRGYSGDCRGAQQQVDSAQSGMTLPRGCGDCIGIRHVHHDRMSCTGLSSRCLQCLGIHVPETDPASLLDEAPPCGLARTGCSARDHGRPAGESTFEHAYLTKISRKAF
jgi:AraC-like DNA-binding protein